MRDKNTVYQTICGNSIIETFWFAGTKEINAGWMHRIVDAD